jgi:hypothetical protein
MWLDLQILNFISMNHKHSNFSLGLEIYMPHMYLTQPNTNFKCIHMSL